ncbi:GNAT family N-acetyltransferase [Paenibacillus zanthoxyli]|uniref:GNAT family N-acetyltransferase n=1 Tax=Paenibacillus zanthoxyli TaxID=369399 RepID=UPI0009FF088A|nr:GNAT family N-acetyltransferase [Paenibacillus zanthoxyli]
MDSVKGFFRATKQGYPTALGLGKALNFCANDGNKVIGTSIGIACYDLVGDCNSFLLIENVVVLPQYQGQGVGKQLMQALEDFGEINHCKYVILVSESKRESSHRFYESIGYSTDQRGFKKQLMKQV